MLVVLGLVLSGCWSGELRGRIAGTVTLQGQPLSEGVVLFTDDTQGIHMTARLRPDGSYEVLTAQGEGLPLGTYRVCVGPLPPEPLSEGTLGDPPMMETTQFEEIPQKYRDYKTSGLTLTLKQGENRFDITM